MNKFLTTKYLLSKLQAVRNRTYAQEFIRSRIHKSRFLSSAWNLEYVGQNNMDADIEKILNWENGYFIELGAGDGISYSNTLHLELYHGWRGVLIEPSFIEFEKLKSNRSNMNAFVNCACVDDSYKRETIELIYSGHMTVDTNEKLGFSSPEDHARKGAAFIDIDTYRFHAKAVTLNNLLIENDSPREIDFLSLDVEGSELNVLKGLDLNFFVVKFILIETRDFEVIDLYLNLFGYKFVDKFSDQDFLFKKI